MSHELKLQRGDEHLHDLDAAIGAFIKGEPYQLYLERDIGTGATVLRVRVRQSPPPSLSLLLGDCVQNYRSALDHLTFALAVENAGPQPPSEKRCQFPIYSSLPNPSPVEKWQVIADLSPAAKVEIERLQPYHHAQYWVQPLWLLAELSNVDKHRFLNLMGGTGRDAEFVLNQKNGPTPGITRMKIPPSGRLVDGKELLRISPPVGLTESIDVEFQYGGQFVITFAETAPAPGASVLGVLHAVSAHLRDVVFPALRPMLL